MRELVRSISSWCETELRCSVNGQTSEPDGYSPLGIHIQREPGDLALVYCNTDCKATMSDHTKPVDELRHDEKSQIWPPNGSMQSLFPRGEEAGHSALPTHPVAAAAHLSSRSVGRNIHLPDPTIQHHRRHQQHYHLTSSPPRHRDKHRPPSEPRHGGHHSPDQLPISTTTER